ncbi:hypothetical protein EYF80_015201 [Liparis tanakae]|uniref:Uncharacterized protein n=1 Tax=Liparis tanakae TaxID=230148 RepID=A0A4Z2IBE7_9TELE|nr:hypothetical protein EYF80_015201 [Liparis tanakae]
MFTSIAEGGVEGGEEAPYQRCQCEGAVVVEEEGMQLLILEEVAVVVGPYQRCQCEGAVVEVEGGMQFLILEVVVVPYQSCQCEGVVVVVVVVVEEGMQLPIPEEAEAGRSHLTERLAAEGEVGADLWARSRRTAVGGARRPWRKTEVVGEEGRAYRGPDRQAGEAGRGPRGGRRSAGWGLRVEAQQCPDWICRHKNTPSATVSHN